MRFITNAAFSIVILAFCAFAVQADDAKVHRVSIQVDQNDPAVMNLADGFRAVSFAETAATMTGDRRHTSLVPTQLVRLLDDPDGVGALRSFDAVLLGGAATTPTLLARAHDAGVRAVTTYGMTETCGGCVYDGSPLAGVRVDLDAEGRVLIGGPVLATGFLDRVGEDRIFPTLPTAVAAFEAWRDAQR